LGYASELGYWYGNTPYTERVEHGESEFLKKLPGAAQSFAEASGYPPNLVFTGSMTIKELEACGQPWYENLRGGTRYGRYGEIMPEDEFIGLMDICDVFDLIWLERTFAESVRSKLERHPLLGGGQLNRLEAGHDAGEISAETDGAGALPLYFGGRVIGCCRKGHDIDHNLSAHVLLENLVCKAGGVLSLLHLIKNSGAAPEDIEFVIECSEEAVGDVNQRGGGNMAKAVAEIAGCVNSTGCDVRGFCAAPVDAIILASSLVAAGVRKNVAVVAGGSLQKLFMNSRDHVRKDLPALENCLGNFAALIVPQDGVNPEIRLDAVGSHTVGAGSSPQAITTALVYEPLQKIGLGFADIDKYAPELHIPEITMPAGAGNVPESNYKMIAALAVMKKQLEKSGIQGFILEHGLPGFAHTQGHIPSGVPFLGHAADAIRAGEMTRAMIIGKGSLFLGRLTNLADGLSFIVEKPEGAVSGASGGSSMTREDVKAAVLDALSELALSLRK
jgi:betaine reductase